jgi:hypothetical protein
VKDNSFAIVGALILAILGWALTAIVTEIDYESEQLDALQERVAIIETILHDHKDLEHD